MQEAHLWQNSCRASSESGPAHEKRKEPRGFCRRMTDARHGRDRGKDEVFQAACNFWSRSGGVGVYSWLGTHSNIPEGCPDVAVGVDRTPGHSLMGMDLNVRASSWASASVLPEVIGLDPQHSRRPFRRTWLGGCSEGLTNGELACITVHPQCASMSLCWISAACGVYLVWGALEFGCVQHDEADGMGKGGCV